MSEYAERRHMPDLFKDLDRRREEEDRAFRKTPEHQEHLRQRYEENHRARVLAIREETASEVREEVAVHDALELGRRLVAWLINSEIDRRALVRLPGETYAAVIAAKSQDVRGQWAHDEELRALTFALFPCSRPAHYDALGRLT